MSIFFLIFQQLQIATTVVK